jgi:hypothetical protein
MQKLGEEIWRDALAIKYSLQKVTWYMRGGMSYTDILNMSTHELTNINKIIEENLETTKKTKLPFF